MVAQQYHGNAWYAERDRRRSTVCSWFLRERLRRVDWHDQRPVLVCWIEEALLKRKPGQFTAAGLFAGPGRFASAFFAMSSESRDSSNLLNSKRCLVITISGAIREILRHITKLLARILCRLNRCINIITQGQAFTRLSRAAEGSFGKDRCSTQVHLRPRSFPVWWPTLSRAELFQRPYQIGDSPHTQRQGSGRSEGLSRQRALAHA